VPEARSEVEEDLDSKEDVSDTPHSVFGTAFDDFLPAIAGAGFMGSWEGLGGVDGLVEVWDEGYDSSVPISGSI
jgi:hypothetical protein